MALASRSKREEKEEAIKLFSMGRLIDPKVIMAIIGFVFAATSSGIATGYSVFYRFEKMEENYESQKLLLESLRSDIRRGNELLSDRISSVVQSQSKISTEMAVSKSRQKDLRRDFRDLRSLVHRRTQAPPGTRSRSNGG